METDMSLISLVSRASTLVQLVMLALLAASFLSWFVIFTKHKILKVAREDAMRFEDQFWSGINLADLYSRLKKKGEERRGMARIFESGFAEFLRMRQQGRMGPNAMVEGAQRAMRIALTRETEELELRLNFLATVGSTSPYIGLFGTVWGIMSSFHALGGVSQATLNMVAPGISEALVATAMGLVAAIPAVIAYNRYSSETNRLDGRFEDFSEEFLNIMHRQLPAGN